MASASSAEDLVSSSLFSVRDKTVLVTGGSRGIGYMLARGFLINGARVYIASRDSESSARAQAELAEWGECRALLADVSKEDALIALSDEIAKREQQLHVLINNAGAVAMHPIGQFPARDWDAVLALNLKTPFMLTQALLPLLIRAATGERPACVINIGSIAAHVNDPEGSFSYCASKAGLSQLTRNLSHVLAPHRITVNTIAPGSVRTEMFEQHASVEEHQARVALGRLGEDADLLGAALYLASPAGRWVTGTTLTVDGGMLIA